MKRRDNESLSEDLLIQERLQSRKYKSLLKNLCTILSFIEKEVDKDDTVFLTQTNKGLLKYYANLHETIDHLKKLMVISVLSNSYLPGQFSKRYKVNRAELSFCIRKSKEYGGVPNIVDYRGYTEDSRSVDVKESEVKRAYEAQEYTGVKVRGQNKDDYDSAELLPLRFFRGKCDIGHRLLVDRRKYYFDLDDVSDLVSRRNLLFKKYQMIALSINNGIQRAEEKISYRLNLTYSSTKYIDENGKRLSFREAHREGTVIVGTESGRYLIKIGARATCRLCNYDKRESTDFACVNGTAINKNPPASHHIREDYLDERFGKDNWEAFDVHASVPRVSHLLQNEENDFGDLNEDIYFSLFGNNISDYAKLVNESVDEWEGPARAFFKSIFLTLLFSPSGKAVLNNLLFKEKNGENEISVINEGDGNGTCTTKKKEEINWTSICSKHGKQAVIDLLDKWKKIIDAYCNPDIPQLQFNDDTKVFFHESNIYLEVRMELLRRGIDTVQIYDEFIFRKGTKPMDFEEIIKKCALKYKKALYRSQVKKETGTFCYYPRFNKRYFLKNISDKKTNAMLFSLLVDTLENQYYFGSEQIDTGIDDLFDFLFHCCPPSRFQPDGTLDEEFEEQSVLPAQKYLLRMRNAIDVLGNSLFSRASDSSETVLALDAKKELVDFVFSLKGERKIFEKLKVIK